MKLLLESHIPRAVARELSRRCPNLAVVHFRDWTQGRFLHVLDEDLLGEAANDDLTLATYDLKTIPPLFRRLAEEGRHHTGVVLIDDATVASSKVGGLVAALAALWRAHGTENWTDRCLFLQRRRGGN